MLSLKSLKLLIITPFFLSGCGVIAGLFEDPVTSHATVGGLAGSAVGAGTGALIGEYAVGGEAGTGALIGAGAGIPVGILVGVGYYNYKMDAIIAENDRIIRDNQGVLTQNEAVLEAERTKFEQDSWTLEPDEDLKDYIFTGPTLGVPTR